MHLLLFHLGIPAIRECVYYLQKQDYKMALRKYRKALRYLDICWEKDGIDEGESTLLYPRYSHSASRDN